MGRDRDDPPAIRVYTVCDESRYLIVRNVPALGCGDELSKLFGSYGVIDECKPMDAEDCDPFTDVYWIKFSLVSNARFAKRKLDESIFLGNRLKVSYAPQYESLLDIKEKLEGRRKEVVGRTKSAAGRTEGPKYQGSNNSKSSMETSNHHWLDPIPSHQMNESCRETKGGCSSHIGDAPLNHVSSNKEYFPSPSMNETVRLVREKLDKIKTRGENLDAATTSKRTKGRDVYILGSANVGKSAFINAMLKLMARNDPVAGAAQKYKPMQSPVPETTLGPIRIEAFQGGGNLFDTHGVHLHHRQAAVVHSDDLPSLVPQSRLKGQSFHVVSRDETIDIGDDGLNGFSLFWGALVRIDVIKVLPKTRLTIYGPNKLKVHIISTVKADEFYHNELGTTLTLASSKQRAESWLGLQSVKQVDIKFEDTSRPACDIAIFGLGWIAVEPVSGSDMDGTDGEQAGELHFAVHVPKPVEIFIRLPLPVGKAGEDWYQY